MAIKPLLENLSVLLPNYRETAVFIFVCFKAQVFFYLEKIPGLTIWPTALLHNTSVNQSVNVENFKIFCLQNCLADL